MYDLHKRYPWLIGSSSMLVFLIVALIGTPIGNQFERWAGLPLNSGVLIQQVLLVIVAALAATVFEGWREAGFAKPKEITYRINHFKALPLVGSFFPKLYFCRSNFPRWQAGASCAHLISKDC